MLHSKRVCSFPAIQHNDTFASKALPSPHGKNIQPLASRIRVASIECLDGGESKTIPVSDKWLAFNSRNGHNRYAVGTVVPI